MDEVNIVVVVPEANEMVCSGGRYYVEVTPLRLLPIIYAYCKMHTHNTPGTRLLFFFEGRPQRLLRGAVLLPQDYTNEQSAKRGYMHSTPRNKGPSAILHSHNLILVVR